MEQNVSFFTKRENLFKKVEVIRIYKEKNLPDGTLSTQKRNCTQRNEDNNIVCF